MAVFSFTHCFCCSRLVQLFWVSVEMELLSIWLMTCRLLSLWFSHTQARQNEKTSPQISCIQLILKVLIRGPQPIELGSTCLIGHHSTATLGLSEAGVRLAYGGTLFTVQQSRSICCKLTSCEYSVGSPYKSPLGLDATCQTYWLLIMHWPPNNINLISDYKD